MGVTQQYVGYGDDVVEPATGADPDATIADGQSVPLDPRAPFERGEVLGRYVVLETLGAGGMGIVLAAYDSTLDRRVALKLLHRGASSDPDNHTRLLREAQALAKLSHPGVVSVYDVGELRGQVFIAMEFIDGPNLRRWLRDNPRDTHRILSFFLRAGRALQAAHDAGIVHRDFKPDNVLIGPDGRAHVTDFGLALEANVDPLSADPGTSSSTTHDRLTQTGVVMGTPAYMPIEQHAGKPTDHRSDQFSFCVALFEALYGIRPFSGANARELCLAIRRAQFPPAPAGVSVPRRVHRAILRGLAPKPDDRHPNMRALLRAIKPPARTRNTWLVGSVGGLALGAGLVAIVNTDADSQPCSAFADRMRAVYDDEHQQQILAAFTATGLPYAQAAFDTTSAALDSYAQQWVSGATEACLATERGEQSEHMLDLRMHCLDQDLEALSAMVEVLTEADAYGVQQAPQVSTNLPDVRLCSDLEALPGLALLPADAAQEADARTLLPVLSRARTLIISDRHDDANALLSRYQERFAASTYPVVAASYQAAMGRILRQQEKLDEAGEHLETAFVLALEHGLDDIAARSAIILGAFHSQGTDTAVAIRWFDVSLALSRAAGSSWIEASALATSADLYTSMGQLDEAVDRTRRAVELIDDDDDYPPRARVELLLAYASALHQRDNGDAGLPQLEEARNVVQSLDGEGPALMKLEHELSVRAALRGDTQTAVQHTEKTLELARIVYGPDSRNVAAMSTNLAVHLQHLGRFEESRQTLERAAAIMERTRNTPVDTRRAQVLMNLASVLVAMDRLSEAKASISEGERLADATDAKTELACVVASLYANVERLEGDLVEARRHAERSLSIATDIFGESHYRTRDALTGLAHVVLDQGHNDEARRLAERASAIDTTVKGDRGDASLVLALALWRRDGASDADRRRAISLARRAYADLKGAPTKWRELEEVRDWLDQHDQGFAPG